MTSPILPVNISIPAIVAPSPAGAGGADFKAAFADAIANVEGFQQNAQASVDRFLSGEGEELHHVALTAQQAELAFQLFMQVRNKIVSAYQEVMRMQV
jgi:flagellar hook-basal body complex protein FliE